MRHLLFFCLTLCVLTSCKVFRSNLMLKTSKDFAYDNLIDSLSRMDYKIAANDIISVRIEANNGFKLVNVESNQNNLQRTNEIEAVVASDGTIKMPVINTIKIDGLAIKEAEMLLEDKYSVIYVDPYVNIRVTNRRVIVFPGNGGSARVIPLTSNNVTVLEVLANAGGILEDGKAYKVKLIRENPNDKNKPYVYLMDLSRIDGIKMGKSVVQAGDILYVEPRYRPLTTFNREIAPIITLLTSTFILYQLIRR